MITALISALAAVAATLSAYWARQASRLAASEQRADRNEGRRQFDEDQARQLFLDASNRLTRDETEHEIALLTLRQLRDDRRSGRYGPMAAALITDQLEELTTSVDELLERGQQVDLQPADDED